MLDKQSLQALNDTAQKQADQLRNIQFAIKKLKASTKESEVYQQQEALMKCLDTFLNDANELLERTANASNQIQSDQGKQRASDDNGKSKDADTDKATDNGKRLPSPSDQEHMYHLRALMMPQYQAKNNALKAELVIKTRRNELLVQRNHKQINYNRDTNLSAVTTLRAINMYEKRAQAAEARAALLQEELDKLNSQDGGKSSAKAKEPETAQSYLGPNTRVNDVIKKNECLLQENRVQSSEIQRLRRTNADLIQKVKHAEHDRHQTLSQLSTSEMARKDLYLRLQKQKAQHERLSKSLTRQSSDWIEQRKMQSQLEEDVRWRNVGHAALHGSYDRTFMHPIPRNIDQPRAMYPVENYAQPASS